MLGQLASLGGGMRFRARGAGGQGGVDEQVELAGGVRGLGMAEPADFVRVRNGVIVEALGYSKTGGEVPLAADPSSGG